ncbi:MAG: hypothetical protein BGO03_01225 [Mesorhizobium sp. 61-13]|nr:MAG: hypothetical protein BGO03_01225 [Mesorhizobium sp. 61-13]
MAACEVLSDKPGAARAWGSANARFRTIALKLPVVLALSAAAVSMGVGFGSYTVGSRVVASLTH